MRKWTKWTAVLAAMAMLTACSGGTKTSAPADTTQAAAQQAEANTEEKAGETAGEEKQASSDLAFPAKDITIIVPFAAGGGTDNMARIFAASAGKDYFNGHQLVIENMGGGGAVIGQTYVAKEAKADGYTVMVYTSSAINNTYLKDISYSYTDFKPLVGCNPDAELIAVPKDSPFNSLEELFTYAKDNVVTISTPGHSSGHHIRALNIAKQMGLQFEYIHNDSAAMQLSQLMGGHCDVAFLTVSEGSGTIIDGQAKGLGVMAEERVESIPDVPTFQEQGYDGWVDGADRGFACSKDVPDDVYQYLCDQFLQIAESEEFNTKMKQADMIPAAKSAAEYQKYIDKTAETLEALAPELKSGK